MSFSVTLVRHGQTDLNVKNLIHSGMNEMLNKEGIDQASRLGEYFENCQDKFTKAFCSDFIRAIQTTKCILRNFPSNQEIQVITNPLLRERGYGEWDGMPVKYLLDQAKQRGMSPVLVNAPGGETHEETVERVTGFLKILSEDSKNYANADPPNYLVVTHSAWIHTLMYILINGQSDMTVSGLNEKEGMSPPPNAGFSKFTVRPNSSNENGKKEMHLQFSSIFEMPCISETVNKKQLKNHFQ